MTLAAALLVAVAGAYLAGPRAEEGAAVAPVPASEPARPAPRAPEADADLLLSPAFVTLTAAAAAPAAPSTTALSDPEGGTLVVRAVAASGAPIEAESLLRVSILPEDASVAARALEAVWLATGTARVAFPRSLVGPVRVGAIVEGAARPIPADAPEDERALASEIRPRVGNDGLYYLVATPERTDLVPGENGPLTLELRPAGGLTVRVRTSGGGPVAGATAALASRISNSWAAVRLSDADGRLELPPHLAPAGAATLDVTDPRSGEIVSIPITIGFAPLALTVTLPEPRRGRLTVRFLDARGGPATVSGALAVEPASLEGSLSIAGARAALRLAQLAGASEHTFELPEGRYRVLASAGEASLPARIAQVVAGRGVDVPIAVGPLGELLVRPGLAMGEPATPVARVVGEDLSPLEWSEDAHRTEAGPEDGVLLRFTGVRYVRVASRGRAPLGRLVTLRPGERQELLLPPWEEERAAAADAFSLAVEAARVREPVRFHRTVVGHVESDDIEELDFVTTDDPPTAQPSERPPRGTLFALVLDAAGMPVPSRVRVVRVADEAVVENRVVSLGQMWLELDAGEYECAARIPDEGLEGPRVRVAVGAGASVAVQLRTGDPARAASLEGTVANAARWARERFRVDATPLHDETDIVQAEAEPDGRFRLAPLAPGVRYTVQLSSYRLAGLAESNTIAVTLEPGEVRILDALVAPAPATVRLRSPGLDRAFAAPLDGPERGWDAFTDLDADGALRIDAPAGRYRLRIDWDGDWTIERWSRELTLEAGASLDLAPAPAQGDATISCRGPLDAGGLDVTIEGPGVTLGPDPGWRRWQNLPAGPYRILVDGVPRAAFTLPPGGEVDAAAVWAAATSGR